MPGIEQDPKMFGVIIARLRRSAKKVAREQGLSETWLPHVTLLLDDIVKAGASRGGWLALHFVSLSMLEVPQKNYVAVKGMLIAAHASLHTPKDDCPAVEFAYRHMFPMRARRVADAKAMAGKMHMPPPLMGILDALASQLGLSPGKMMEVNTPMGKMTGVQFDLKAGSKPTKAAKSKTIKMPPASRN